MSQVTIENRITILEGRYDRLDERIDGHDKTLEKMGNKLDDIVKLLSARPTWLVTAMITILTTVSASLIVYVSTVHR